MAFLIDTIDSSGLFAQSANSATIATKDSNGNDITATYQPSGDYYSASNPSGFMTELPSSATDVIDTVTANSGTWGGSALPISAGPGIKLEMVNNTLVASVGSEWIDISNQCTIAAHAGDCKIFVNSASRLCWMCGAWKPSQNGDYITVPVKYAWPARFEISNNVGKHLDFNNTGNSNIATVREADASGTYWSECIFWGY